GQGTSPYILGKLGIGKSSTVKSALEVLGTISGSTIYSTGNIATSGALIAQGASRFKNSISVNGTMSGRSIWVSGTGSGIAPLLANYNPTGTVLMGTGGLRAGTGYLAPQLYIQGRPPVSKIGSGSTLVSPIAMAVQGRYAFVANSGSNTFQVFD